MSSNDGPIILVRGQGTPPVKFRPRLDLELLSKARELRDPTNPVLASASAAIQGSGTTSPGHPRWAKGGVASSLEGVSAAGPGGSAPSGRVGWHSSLFRWVELDQQRSPDDMLPLSDGLAMHHVRVRSG
jgi:hypothetical protein